MNNFKKKALVGLSLMLTLAAFGTSAFAGVLKSPYLIYPGNNPKQMEVLWQDTATETTNTISWGVNSDYTGMSAAVKVPEYGNYNQHRYTITGLTPNTKYYYVVKDKTNGVYGQGSFMTAPPATQNHVRFLAFGDTRTNPFMLDNVMKAMMTFYSQPGNADYQRLIIHNGDWVSSDGESYWTSQWFDPTKTDIRAFTANTPIDGVKGNHEDTSGYTAGFPKYFPFPYPNETLKMVAPLTDSNGNPYYDNLYWSFDYGPVHFTCVDEYSDFTPGSAQYTWLVNDLASTTKQWKILVYHEPAYSAGSDADNIPVRALEPLVTQYGVDLIFCGHSHNYARTGAYNLTQANGDPVALGVPHITSGGGANSVVIDQTNLASYPHVITAWQGYEFMTFDVEGQNLTMTAWQVNGASLTQIQSAAAMSLSKIEEIDLHHYTNVSSQVTVQAGALSYNSTTHVYSCPLKVTNIGATALTGNIHVVLDGLINLDGIGNADNEYDSSNPKHTSKIAQAPATGPIPATPPATGFVHGPGALISDVTLVTPHGSYNGEPMFLLTQSGLGEGDEATITLKFTSPDSLPNIPFNPIVYQE